MARLRKPYMIQRIHLVSNKKCVESIGMMVPLANGKWGPYQRKDMAYDLNATSLVRLSSVLAQVHIFDFELSDFFWMKILYR